MAQQQRVILLNFTSLKMITDIGGDGLARGRDILAHEPKLHGHLCEVFDGHCLIVHRDERATNGHEDLAVCIIRVQHGVRGRKDRHLSRRGLFRRRGSLGPRERRGLDTPWGVWGLAEACGGFHYRVGAYSSAILVLRGRLMDWARLGEGWSGDGREHAAQIIKQR